MKLNLYLLILILLQLTHLSSALISSSSMGSLCDEHDQVALLQLKHSFSLDQTNCPNPNPRLSSWVLHNETNQTVGGCCSWEGVTCEVSSSRVTGLDLSYDCLRGVIDSANPIFLIPHLQQLNLAGNDFAQSEIPSDFGKFSMLNSLNLSQASLSGSIPPEILELSSLTSLDLSGNPSLNLPLHGLESIARHMKDLTELSLSQINISSAVPATFTNLTSLRMLELESCNLQDNLPTEIFLLPTIESLNLIDNNDLYGQLPEFPIGRSSLRSLQLSSTNFQGELPRSIGNLVSLQTLDVSECFFSGSIPYSIGSLVNLTTLYLDNNQFSEIASSFENLTSLTYMSLANNPFSVGSISSLSWIGKLTKLKRLYLQETNLYGSIQSSLAKLEQLEELDISFNELSGLIPSWVGNLTRLVSLSLHYNFLEGNIPSSIFSLKNLESLYLGSNTLNGTVDITMFHEQKKLNKLGLAYSNLSVVGSKFVNFSLPNLEYLDLGYCNIREFPLFLKNHDRIKALSLVGNKIPGEIPGWFLNVSTKTMVYLELSHNFLTGFQQPCAVIRWSKLEYLDLGTNQIHGPLPMLPPSITLYIVSHNFLGGELSPAICKANTLLVLDLSYNTFSGAIPDCFLNMGSSLQILNLAGNKFEGKIPQIQTDECSLQCINLSQNRLKGELPRSLAKCRDLQILELGNNRITDTFPSWLGRLPQLQGLILKSNNFHGPMGSPSSMEDFLVLRIIDLSSNALTGALPSEYFSLWKAMMNNTSEKQLTYLQVVVDLGFEFASQEIEYTYTMSAKLTNKGMDRVYDKVSNMMVLLSLSGNKFVGEIPESIGDLVGLNGLDLSNNKLTGSIPSALGELKQLESLDLSLNMLSGEIPQQLCQLTFLGYLNVSYNNLSGKIPEGGQLGTFGNSSFVGNPGLYGLPLSNTKDKGNEPTAAHEGQDPGSSDHTKLVSGFEGLATGLAIGLGIGYIITTRYHQWFVKTCLKLRYRKQYMH